LKKGDISSLPYSSDSFDKALAVTSSFLADPVANPGIVPRDETWRTGSPFLEAKESCQDGSLARWCLHTLHG
jgi:hypothetical protein